MSLSTGLTISWRITDIKGDGVMLEIDRTNYPHWERKKIIKANEVEYKRANNL